MTQAQLFDTFDISYIKLSPPKASKMAAGCKTAYVQGEGGKKIAIQTPLMTLPWDIAPRKLDDNANVTANLSLSFVGIEENNSDNELLKFRNFLIDFDIKIKTLIEQMDGALGKKSESKVLDANFKDTIKESPTGEYPPTIQPKIWLTTRPGGSSKCIEDHEMEIQVFDPSGRDIGGEELKKNCPAAAIIVPNYVWCSALGVGITWSVKQVVIQPQNDEQFSNFKLGNTFDGIEDDIKGKRLKFTDEDDDNNNDFIQGTQGGNPFRSEHDTGSEINKGNANDNDNENIHQNQNENDNDNENIHGKGETDAP